MMHDLKKVIGTFIFIFIFIILCAVIDCDYGAQKYWLGVKPPNIFPSFECLSDHIIWFRLIRHFTLSKITAIILTMMKNYTNIGLMQLIGDSSYLTSMYAITI